MNEDRITACFLCNRSTLTKTMIDHLLQAGMASKDFINNFRGLLLISTRIEMLSRLAGIRCYLLVKRESYDYES